MGTIKINGKDLIGKKINEWTVLDVVSTDKLLCRCSCGKVKEVYKTHLVNDKSFSCGCRRRGYDKDPLIGKQFGEWTVIEKAREARMYTCKCSCGTVKDVIKTNLLRGFTTSCGCKRLEKKRETFINKFGDTAPARMSNPRTQEQIQIASSEETMKNYILGLDKNNRNLKYIAEDLDLSMSHLYILVKKFNLQSVLDYKSTSSQTEQELRSYIESIYSGKIVYNTRDIITPQELDIYLPEKSIAIEFNGNYWHSEINKDKKYHQDKTINAYKAGVRLIHIFEYEWFNNKDAIKNYLRHILSNEQNIIYARNTSVIHIDKEAEKEFENKYHLQGYTQSTTALALQYKGQIVGIMTFGKSRFNENTTELIRLCYKDNIIVIGGAEKLFKAYITENSKTNIISYCDISKFTGQLYTKLGFNAIKITEPNYIWVNSRNDAISRYKTQRNRLVDLGLCEDNETESDAMHKLNYYKVYNCGNIRFEYNAK